ncbi:uncharacterized protein LOC130946232 [Arachis stenosperma]|uniref:uncharacterized protein LOC130946232 n=1 Tax=Arachis stenosperma TaxID=217475 RepID=UPI0025ABB413|nr:uncharacterized protein LOC130946232 [Arachis stenosperma]
MASDNNPPFSSVDIQALASLVNQINLMQSNATRTQSNPALNPASPYFLHPGENSGSSLLSTPLVGNNYQIWEKAMWRTLTSKNKLGFVNGSIKKPERGTALFEAWKRSNTYVVSLINQSLSPEIAKSVVWINSAEKLLKELKHRYCHGDIYRIAELEEDLFATRQGELTITAYYTKLKEIWEELDNLCPIPICSRCSENCTCELNILRGYKKDSSVVGLLRGLNDQYSTVRSQIMLMKPLPKVDAIFSDLLQQERQFNINEIVEGKALITNARTDGGIIRGRDRGKGGRGGHGNYHKTGRGSKQCSHCGKNGHLIDTCYKKHGFPPHFKNGGASINNLVAEESDDNNNQSQ